MKNKYELLIGGDFCPTKIINQVFKDDELVDKHFSSLFDIFRNTEFSIVNLECPVLTDVTQTKVIKKIGPSLYSCPDFLSSLKKNGLSAVTMSNNHIMDFGKDGLEQTIASLDKVKLDYVGAGLSANERRKALIKDINGFKVAILNFAENEFSTINEDHGANPINTIDNYHDINYYKQISDYVFVIVHSGHEEYQLPSPWMQKQFRFYIDAGCDAVFTHHSHCYSGYEIYNEKPIFYGLGNLSFYWEGLTNFGDWNYGFLVGLNLLGNSKVSFNIIPYTQGVTGEIGVSILDVKSEEYKKVFLELERLNSIIADANLIQLNFSNLIQKKSKYTLSYFSPYENRVLKHLSKKGFIPNFFSDDRKLLLINLFRCEAHSNVVIEVLRKNLNI